MIKRGTANSVLVELEKIEEDEYNLASGVKIFINNMYAPKQNSSVQLDVNVYNQRAYGKCVVVPDKLTKGDLLKFDTNDLKFLDSVVPEVQSGDIVYFVYTAVNKQSLIEEGGKIYCKINYSSILCIVRNGEIIPIGGYIICDEYFGENISVTDVGGKKVFGETRASGLIGVIDVPTQTQAIVRIIGKPLIGDEIEVSVGDKIVFPNRFGYKEKINSKEYIFLRYWDVQVITGNDNGNKGIR